MGRWWLTEGVIVKFETFYFKIIRKKGKLWLRQSGNHLIPLDDRLRTEQCVPIGVPFDCMPEWAVAIQFVRYGDDINIYVYDIEGDRFRLVRDFHHCPDEWKGKAFEITDELRGLLNGSPSVVEHFNDVANGRE